MCGAATQPVLLWLLLWLLPRAPDLLAATPGTEAFGWIKQYIQDNADEAAYNPWKVLNDAFASIGPELAQKYFNDMLRKLDEC